MRKALISMLVSAAMVMGQMPVMAADSGPLTPGSAAGVQQAQGDDASTPTIIWIGGLLFVLVAGVWILTQGTSNTPITVSTTGTAPQH